MKPETEAPKTGDTRPAEEDEQTQEPTIHVAPKQKPEDLVVPLVDEDEAGRIYDPSLLRWALWGAVLGGLLLGWLGYGMAEGGAAVAGLGQWAASGTTIGAVTGGGLGLAIGGLTGALLALYRMPARRLHEQEETSSRATTSGHVVIEPSPDGS